MSKTEIVPIFDITSEEFQGMIADCKAILSERGFNSRMELIQGKWELGERILTDSNYIKYSKDSNFIQGISDELGCSTSNIYQCLSFYNQFPEWNNFTNQIEGKNVSWYQVTQKYLGGVEKIEMEKKVKKKYYLDEIIEAFIAWAEENISAEKIDDEIGRFKQKLIK